MDELIDIIDKEGKPTGKTALKSEAHRNGWYHNTVHLWLFTKNGEVLLQQRSRNKTIHPLLWDVSVAGHIDAGESFEDAGVREAFEEIGLLLRPNQLKHIGTKLHKGEYNNGAIKDFEFHQTFIAELKTPIEALHISKEEVEAVKLVSSTEFDRLVKYSGSNGYFIPSNKAHYRFVMEQINAALL